MVGVLIETTNSYNGFIANLSCAVIARSIGDEAIDFFALLRWIASLSLAMTKDP